MNHLEDPYSRGGVAEPPPEAEPRQASASSGAVEEDEPLFGGTPFRDAHSGGDLNETNEVRSFYSLLNVDQDATEEQIREAYKSLAGTLEESAAKRLTGSGVPP